MCTFWTPDRMGIYKRMLQPKNSKKKAFAANSQNLKQPVDIKVTFISEKKLLGWMGMCIRIAQLFALKKKAFEVNSQHIKQKIGIQVNSMLKINFQKYIF